MGILSIKRNSPIKAVAPMKALLFTMALLCFAKVKAAEQLPNLPEPVSNNAIAEVNAAEGKYLISFMGLGAGKTYADVHNKAWMLKVGDKHWQEAPEVPSSLPLKGRLASIAIGVKEYAYVFGGYTVAQDHTEISSPDNFRFDPINQKYTRIAPMPVPTDDAVALSYQDRYIYIISGWHNDGNVNLVQIYDIESDSWTQGSPFLGKPVFGHAGGIVDNKMVVCDGVIVAAQAQKRRTFKAEPSCYLGMINPQQHEKIDWRTIPHPTGVARYRMAAAGDESQKRIVFMGGSDNPYNYDGIGYDGKPSGPSNKLWLYDLEKEAWSFATAAQASMDHRGLILLPEQQKALTIGGMKENQTVISTVQDIALP